jgi:hypothetical protein
LGGRGGASALLHGFFTIQPEWFVSSLCRRNTWYKSFKKFNSQLINRNGTNHDADPDPESGIIFRFPDPIHISMYPVQFFGFKFSSASENNGAQQKKIRLYFCPSSILVGYDVRRTTYDVRIRPDPSTIKQKL